MPDDIYLGALPAGHTVVVIGGGAVGCEAAWHLAQDGRQVSIVEMLPQVAGDLFLANREMLLNELRRHEVSILTGTTVTSLAPGQVRVRGPQGEAELTAEAIVLAVGRRPCNQLEAAARARRTRST